MRAVKKLKNDRAADYHHTPLKFLSVPLPHVAQALHSLFQHDWRSGRVHAEWTDGITVSLYKGKGPKNKCSSYNLSLFLCRTVLSHVLLERIQPLL